MTSIVILVLIALLHGDETAHGMMVGLPEGSSVQDCERAAEALTLKASEDPKLEYIGHVCSSVELAETSHV